MFQFVMCVTLVGKQVVMLVLKKSVTVNYEPSSTETSCVSISTVVNGQLL